MSPKGCYIRKKSKPTWQKVRKLSPEEAAWLGAMVEGEGSIMFRVKRGGRWQYAGARTLDRFQDAEAVSVRLVCVYSSDVETISTCLRLAGAGKVYYRPPRPNYTSPRGRQAFAAKNGWVWVLEFKKLCQELIPQLYPYLISKRYLASLAVPIAGGSCHPSHQKPSGQDPRAIKKQHRWKHGHDPADDDATEESPWVYLDLEVSEGPETEPDQRFLLTGGPESGLPCERCEHMTNIASREFSKLDIYEQEDVHVAGNVTEADRARWAKEKFVILACSNCDLKMQFRVDLLPALRRHRD